MIFKNIQINKYPNVWNLSDTSPHRGMDCDAEIYVLILSEHDGVSNHMGLDCSTVCLGADQWKHQSSTPLWGVTGGFLSHKASNAENVYIHYDDVIMTMLASQITSLTIVYSIVYSGVNQRKHQSSASLAFVLEIHRGPVNFPHKWPVTRKMFPFDDVIMLRMSWWLHRYMWIDSS